MPKSDFKIVEFAGFQPRRIFVPLCRKPGTADASWCKDEKGEKDEKAVTAYWSHFDQDKITWLAASVRLNDRLPRDLWQGAVRRYRVLDDDTEEPVLTDPESPPILDLDISLMIGRSGFGLLITWAPSILSQADALVVTGSPTIKSGPRLRGRSVVALCLPELVISNAVKTDDEGVYRQNPPWSTDGTIWRWLVRRDVTRLSVGTSPGPSPRPPPALLVTANPASETNGVNYALVLDFGTSATTASVVASSAMRSNRFEPFGDLVPWTHIANVPALDQHLGEDRIEFDPYRWSGPKDFIPDGFPVVPNYVSNARVPAPVNTGNVALPSLMCTLSGVGAENVGGPSVCIAGEAQALLDFVSHPAVDISKFNFSPKRHVGIVADRDPNGIENNPAEGFLRELFNQIHGGLTTRRPAILPKITKVCCGYPVTWTKAVREQYTAILKSAMGNSYLAPLMDPRNGSVIDLDYSLDEATAAFLGFVKLRYGGLDGDDLVDCLRPFEPDPEKARQPGSIRVLVFDCGGGTTDLVLLDVSSNPDTRRVQSTVLQHFAIDVGGIEITRAIAEVLKEHLRMANPNADPLLLRTNLRDLGIDKALARGAGKQESGKTIERSRREFIIALAEEAERLKLEISKGGSPEIDWANVLDRNRPLKVPPESRLPKDFIDNTVSKVFQPAFHQISRWAEKHGKLDLVLMTGRSAQLPTIRERVEEAIPEHCRPFAIDFVSCGQISLDGRSSDQSLDGKLVVSAGLAQHYWNLVSPNRRGLCCNPIDEKRRTRAIGRMFQAPNGTMMPAFDGSPGSILIPPDNEAVNSDEEYACIEENPTSNGFVLGINFAGPQTNGQAADQPTPFARVRIDGGHKDAYRCLTFVFQQLSATEIRLKRVDCVDMKGRVSRHEPSVQGDDLVVFHVHDLTITIKPYRVIEDFRITGRIHLSGMAAIDQD